MTNRRVKTDKGTIRKPTFLENMVTIRKFLLDTGHQSGEFGRCDRIQGPQYETWTDRAFPCTCGHDDAVEEYDAVLKMVPDRVLQNIK